VSCHAGLNVRTTGLDRAELNGSCRDHLTGCRPGPSTARLVIQAGPGPLPIVPGCAHTEPNCAGPFTTVQIFRTTMTSRLGREERVVMLWHGLGRVERAMKLWFGRDEQAVTSGLGVWCEVSWVEGWRWRRDRDRTPPNQNCISILFWIHGLHKLDTSWLRVSRIRLVHLHLQLEVSHVLLCVSRITCNENCALLHCLGLHIMWDTPYYVCLTLHVIQDAFYYYVCLTLQ
jgi:hypothetical protein